MNIKSREYLIPILITLALLLVSFLLHLQWCDSPMKASQEHWQNRINTHLNAYPFSIRYLTTQSTILLNKITGLPYRESFYLLQYFLAFLLGPIFYRYLREMNFSQTWSSIGVVILMSAYPVMAAHFEPVHTWDDIWTYIFLTLTFFSVAKERFLIGAVFFILACFSREQTTIFYPVYFGAIWLFGGQLSWKRRAIVLLLPILIFGAFYISVSKTEAPTRFQYITANFEHALRARDSLFSWFVAFGFTWVGSIMTLIRMIGHDKSRLMKMLFWGGIYMGVANTFFTFFFTAARETRIFFPPFIFLIPLSLSALKPAADYIRLNPSIIRKTLMLLAIAALIVGGVFLGKAVFHDFEYRQCREYGRIWAGANFGAVAALILVYSLIPRCFLQGIVHDRSELKSDSSSSF